MPFCFAGAKKATKIRIAKMEISALWRHQTLQLDLRVMPWAIRFRLRSMRRITSLVQTRNPAHLSR